MENLKMDKPKAPLVTVYITNHNYGRYIQKAISSVLNQTLQDFELIIIDDGSTDNSREIIETYVDPGKIMVIFQQNQGLNITNNIALRTAKGRFILRLDADDYLDENALLILSGVLERNPDIGLVFPDYFLVDEAGEILEVVRRHDFADVTLLDQPAHGACTMIRRRCLLELGGYDESFRSQDGYEFWLRFIQRYRAQNVNLPLFYYRQHSSSLTRNEEHILSTRSQILEKQARRNGRRLNALAIIPVRGRSTDPQSPALRPLGGQALIDWTIQAALESERVADVVLTTPDEELLAYVADKYADRVLGLKRDALLALPNTFIEDTLVNALARYNRRNADMEALVILYIESPFRTGRHIDNAIDLMELFDTEIVIGVRPDTDMFYRHNGSGLQPLRTTRLLRLERDELYREVGQMRVVRRDFFEANRQISRGRMGHLVLDQCASLCLRSEWEWQVAEFLAKEKLFAISDF